MRRLDRYIFREVLVPGLIALVVLTFIVAAQKGGWLLEIIFRQSPTVAEIWEVLAALLPVLLPVTIPMAVLMGILTGFSRLSSDSEAIAMRAAGISMRRILRPVLLFATLAWIATQTLTVWVAPETQASLRTRLTTLALKNPPIELRPRVFYEAPNLPWKLYFDSSSTGDGIRSKGIILVDAKNLDYPDFTFAQSGRYSPTNSNLTLQLNLQNGSTHVLCPPESTADRPPGCGSSNSYLNISFASTTFARELPPPRASKRTVQESPTRDLWERWRAGTASIDEVVEFHQRLALPFACFAFTLVGLPLGVTTNRGGRSTGLVLSLVLMFGYYMAYAGGIRAGLPPGLGAWLPNIVFLALGIFLLARSDHQHENRIIASIVQGIQWVQAKLFAFKPRKLNVSQWAYSLSHRFRLFRLLDSYVLRGFWFFFAIVLGVFASLFIVVTLFELLPDILSNKVKAGTVIVYFLFLMPQIFFWVTPLAVLLAILINLGTLTKTNEILAVKAGAVSLYRMSLPIILMAGLLSGVVYVMQDYVLPWTNQRQDQYHDMIKGHAPQTYRDPSRKLMMGSGNRLYYYTFFDPALKTFGRLIILRLDPTTFQPLERLDAKRATWNGTTWILEEVQQRQFSVDHKIHTEIFDKKSVEMDAPAYFTREVREADQMNYSELQLYVADLQRSGFDVGRLTVDLYQKVSFPVVSFIMALIGVPFSFKTGKKGAFYGIGFCVAVGIIYWLTFELFGKLGGINQLSPFVAAWFPNIIFGASGLWMMLRMKT
jgi:LPS export ABC transporter permease LptG/LPS export ABC transporter permease LptF